MSVDINGNSTDNDDTVKKLKDWLLDRVADDNDIVVDELQEEHAAFYEELELKADNACPGSEEYNKNQECLKTSIAKLKTLAGTYLAYRMCLPRTVTTKPFQAENQ